MSTKPDYWAILEPCLEYINKTPSLLSLLYDIGKLPEQCQSVGDAACIAALCVTLQTKQEFEIRWEEAKNDYLVEQRKRLSAEEALRRISKHTASMSDFPYTVEGFKAFAKAELNR